MRKHISEDQIEQARGADVFALAEPLTQLKRVSGGEYAGPCPRCGGEDRFHVTAAWFFCRQCHEKRGDAIEFVRWQQPGLSFAEAVARLIGDLSPKPINKPVSKRLPVRQQPATKPQSDVWRKKAEAIAAEAHERLWESEQVHEYLLGRGLESHTWLQYGLGYRPDVPVPGTSGKQVAPALVIPWRARSGIYALRYRFLQPQDGRKLTAERGSQFAGKLYGGQALPDWVTMPAPDGYVGVQQYCTLLLVEGEINAMSCWQVAGETHLHVLSLGSEGQAIPPAALPLFQRYGQVLVWADKEKVAQGLMQALPGAVGIHSPGGKDANDLLQAGLLGGFLATMRANHAKGVSELEGLLWDLYDAARLPAGIDTGSARVLQRLAAQLGKQAAIYEPEPGRWITVAH